MLPLIADGLAGIKLETDKEIIVLYAEALTQGEGALTAYVESLPTDRTVRALLVISPVVQNVLVSHGFVQEGFDYVKRPVE